MIVQVSEYDKKWLREVGKKIGLDDRDTRMLVDGYPGFHIQCGGVLKEVSHRALVGRLARCEYQASIDVEHGQALIEEHERELLALCREKP